MPKIIEVEGFGKRAFPDDMSQEDIESVLKSQFEPKDSAPPPTQIGTINPETAWMQPQGMGPTPSNAPLMGGQQIAPMGEFLKTEAADTPLIPLTPPKAPNVEDRKVGDLERIFMNSSVGGQAMKHLFGEEVTAQVFRDAYNQGKGIVDFPLTPKGMSSLSGAGAFPATTATVFFLDTLKGLGQQVASTYTDWDKMKPLEKTRAITGILGSTGMAGMLLHGVKSARQSRFAGKTGKVIDFPETASEKSADVKSTQPPTQKPEDLQLTGETQAKVEAAAPVLPAAAAEAKGDVSKTAAAEVKESKTYEAQEREALNASQQLGAKTEFTDKPLDENEPFSGRIAQPTPDGRIIINRREFNDWVSGIPPERRAAAIQSMIAEEHIHTKTSPTDAKSYWDNLSSFEKTLVNRRYTGAWKGDERFTETMMGHEALRGRIQQLAHMTPREIAEAVGTERWTVQGIYALEAAVQNIRKSLGTEASKVQLGILDRVQSNLAVAKASLNQQQQWQDQPAAFNKQKKKEPPEFPRDLEESLTEIFTKRTQKGVSPEALSMGYEPNLFTTLDYFSQIPDSEWGLSGTKRKQLVDWFKSAEGSGWSREEMLASHIRDVDGYVKGRIEDLNKAEKMYQFVKGAQGSPESKKPFIDEYVKTRDEVQGLIDEHQKVLKLFKDLTGSKSPNDFIGPFTDLDTDVGPSGQLDLPLAYNKRRKEAAKATGELGLSFGKWTEESGWKSDLSAKPTGAEAGLKPSVTDPKELIGKAQEFLEKPITISKKAADIESEGQIEHVTRRTVERPNLQEFEEWVKVNHPNITSGQLYEMWKPIIWDSLISAPSSRLKDWVTALNLRSEIEGKGAESRPMREIPEYDPALDPTPRKPVTVKPRTTELGLELPMREAAQPVSREQRIAELRAEADKWEEQAKTAKPARPIEQSDMYQELGVFPPLPKAEVKVSTPTTAREMLRKAEALRAEADIMEEGGGSTRFDEQDTKAAYQRPQDYREKVVTAIALKLFEEAKPKDELLAAKDFFPEDIAWDNPNTQVSPWREIRAQEISDKALLEKLLTDEARGSGDPVSWSKRVVALKDKETGNVAMVSVFRDGRKGLKVTDPSGGGTSVPLDSILYKWTPFVSALKKDPMKGFRRTFRDMSEFDDYIRRSARDQKSKEFEELRGQAPDEIAAQAYDDANADAILAEERVDPAEVEAAAEARYSKSQGGEGEFVSGVEEGEGGSVTGTSAGEARAAMGIGRGQLISGSPITAREATALLNFITDEMMVEKVKSRRDMAKVIGTLADLAQNEQLKPKHWLAISALRKAAREVYRREQERIRMEKKNQKLSEAKKKLGVEDPEFTREDAYRMALDEVYDILQTTPESDTYLARALGQFTRPPREVRRFFDPKTRSELEKPKGVTRELEMKRTVLERDPLGGLPKEKEVSLRPTAETSPWIKYQTQFRREAINSSDPYERWLARYSRQLPAPMPLGGIRGVAENVPKLDTPDMQWVENRNPEPYTPTPERAQSAGLEQRNITLSEYDSGNRPDPRAAEEKFRVGESEPITQAKELKQRQAYQRWLERHDGLSPKDFESPAAFAKKKKDLSALISSSRNKIRAVWGKLRDTDAGLAIGGIPKAIQNARQRHKIKDRLYYALDSLDNSAAEYALRSGNAIKLASMDVLEKGKSFKDNERLGQKRREAAKAIIAATVKILEDGKPKMVEVAVGNPMFGMKQFEPVTNISKKKFKEFKQLCDVGVSNAEKWIRGKDLHKRIIGRKWKKAALKLKEEVEFAESEYLNALQAGKASGKSEWESHPIKQVVDEFRGAMQENINFMIENGVLVKERENYVPGRYEGEVFSDNMVTFGEMRIRGSKPRMPKTFSNYYEAIAKGPYIPVNGDLAELAQSSIVASHRMINRRTWEITTYGIKDPKTGKDIVKKPKQVKVDKVVVDPETGDPTTISTIQYSSPDAHYELVYPNNDKSLVPIAALPSYARAFSAAIAPSKLRSSTVMQTGLAISSALKHGVILIFDSFHPFRLAQYAAAAGDRTLKGTVGGIVKAKSFKQAKNALLDPGTGYKGGYSALNFNPADMAKAVDSGWITKEAAEWALGRVEVNVTKLGPSGGGWGKVTTKEKFTRQQIADKLTKSWGLQAVKINDALYRDAVQNIPLIGEKYRDFLHPFNTFIFDKVTSGLMVETAVRNFERMNKENPKMDFNELGRSVAKDTNVIFGNMGRQGVFRSQTFKDLATMFLLAPMWREGLIQKDMRFIGRSAGWVGSRMAKALKIGYKDRSWQDMPKMGTLGRAYVRGLLTYFIAAQMINLYTRQRPTWENPEKDHEMDAWLPNGNGNGVWLSTFGVFGEVTHQMQLLADKKPTNIQALGQMGVNALGPVGRMSMALVTGEDAQGSKATSSWQWGKNVAAELLPAPITLALPLKLAGHAILPSVIPPPRPGEALQRAAGIVGIKAQLPTKYQAQIMDLVKEFKQDNDFPNDAVILEPTDQDSYTKLRRAIWMDDTAGARKIYQGLITNHLRKNKDDTQADAMERIDDNMGVYAERPWTGNGDLEDQFQLWLIQKHPKQQELLFNAQLERTMEFGKFQAMLPQLAR